MSGVQGDQHHLVASPRNAAPLSPVKVSPRVVCIMTRAHRLGMRARRNGEATGPKRPDLDFPMFGSVLGSFSYRYAIALHNGPAPVTCLRMDFGAMKTTI